MLLKHRVGATSFDDLLTVKGHRCATFKEVCVAMELLDDDAELIKCMEESALFKNARALRDIFCCILINCEPADPLALFELFSNDMMEDFLYKRRGNTDMSDEEKKKFAFNDLLLTLNDTLDQHGKSNIDYMLSMPDDSLQADAIDYDIEYDPNAGECYNTNHPLLNDEQEMIFKIIQACIDGASPSNVYHIDSPAGCGKTFLANVVLAYVRKDRQIAISTATTGISAILLVLGTTAHKRFAFPIPCIDGSVSSLLFDSKESEVIKAAKVIILDEDSLLSDALFECLDRYLKALMGNNLFMGGKLIVMMGDFRQGLPVVRHGQRSSIVANSIKSSPLWKNVTTLRLTRNMRVQKLIRPDSTPQRIRDLNDYAKWLLKIGNGTIPFVHNNIIEVPSRVVCGSPTELRDKVYDDFQQNGNYKNPEYLRQRAILSSRNADIQSANFDMVANQLNPQDKAIISESVDECIEDKGKKLYDPDYLHKIEAPGIPPHRLALKKHACIILIRNLNIKRRHCNGTRCIVEEIKPHVIKARLLDGTEGKDSEIFIPKISLTCKDDFVVPFRRKQFPVLGAYYLTFNRAQGQSLDRVGLLLPRSVFTHGMFYIGVARTGDPEHLFIWADQSEFRNLIKEGVLDPMKTYTKNIVYPEVLDN